MTIRLKLEKKKKTGNVNGTITHSMYELQVPADTYGVKH